MVHEVIFTHYAIVDIIAPSLPYPIIFMPPDHAEPVHALLLRHHRTARFP